MKLARELGYPERMQYSAAVLKDIYAKQNKYKEAFEMYRLEVAMRDSVSNEKNRKEIIKSQLRYEYEKKAVADSVQHAKESEIKNAEIKKQRAEIRAKRNQQYALFGGLGLVIIFAAVMFNRFRVTQRQKNIIESQKLLVEDQKHLVEEKQKEILDSISYASRIQKALLPADKYMEKSLDKLRNRI
jgi:hypothetical protein